MGVILKFPPCVRHVGRRPEQEMQSLVVDQALANLRVPKAACKLMRFYAARSEGFRPSLKMINEATGLHEYNVSRTRALLCTYGLLGYDGSAILVDWVRLRAFACVDVKQMGQKRRWKLSPVNMGLLGDPKNDLHTYIGSSDQYLHDLYVATQEAIDSGVVFPELRGAEVEKLLGHAKNDLHTYIGDNNLVYGPNGWQQVGWYNPFDEPNPPWAKGMPGNDDLPF